MAGDWVKMRGNLWTDPKVVTLASRLRHARATIIGGLHGAWSLLDQHGVKGSLRKMTPDVLDSYVEIPGFTAAMSEIGWIVITDDSLQFPKYEQHNGPTAKRRASNARRQSKARQSSRSRHARVTQDGDGCVTREEKRREEKNIDPPTPLRDSSGAASETDRWKRFVLLYPPNRNGRVPNQINAEAAFRALPPFQQDQVLQAVNHYAAAEEVGQPKFMVLDPVKFLNERWPDWLDPPKSASGSSDATNRVLPLDEFLALNNQRGAQ